MFPQDECQRCGHTYEEHRPGLIAPCQQAGCDCPDHLDEVQVPVMGI